MADSPFATPQYDSFMDRRRAQPGGLNTNVGKSLDELLDAFARGESIAAGDLGQGLAQARHAGGAAAAGDGNLQARIAMDKTLEAALTKAFQLEGIENQRFADAMGFLQSEFRRSNEGFAADNARMDRLMFAGAADRFGREASEGMSALRTSLGARGINPASGAAAAMAGNIGLRQQGQLMGARRDITMDSLRRRDAQRVQRFQQAFGMADFMNQGDSEIGLSALSGLTGLRERQLDKEDSLKEARKARKAQTQAAAIGGIGSLAGAFLA